MAVQITVPNKKEDSAMGRRLFAMGAPLVGTALGGPIGGAIGSLIGSKVAGKSTQESLLDAGRTGIDAYNDAKKDKLKTTAEEIPDDPLKLSEGLKMPEVGSQFSRRSSALSQDPQMAVQEGLNLVGQLPAGHPLREEMTQPLVKAQMLGASSKYKMYGSR